MANLKYTTQQMVDALTETKGMITIAAKRLGCAPNTVRRYIARSPTIAQAKQDAHDEMGDAVELKLYNEAMGGNIAALIFLAKTQLKDRGYVERQEIAGTKDQPIEVNVSDSRERITRLVNRSAARSGAAGDPGESNGAGS